MLCTPNLPDECQQEINDANQARDHISGENPRILVSTFHMQDECEINDGTEAPKKKLFSLQEKLNIINKHDAGLLI